MKLPFTYSMFCMTGRYSNKDETYHMKIYLVLLFAFATSLTFGQNKHLNLGYKGNGLCFGNSKTYNGIRFNLLDNNVDLINGINAALISRYHKSNGIKIAFHSVSGNTNGINLAIWGLDDSISNGITIATGAGGIKIDGLGLAGLSIAADTMNGFFFSLIGTTKWSTDLIEKVSGISIGIIFGVESKKLNGLAIGINNLTEIQNGVVIGIFNNTKELHGFQFGLWNVAENNRICKRMPILNFNFRKKARR